MKGSVLIVEDDPALLRSLATTLSSLGMATGEATTGEAAIRDLRHTAYDVVLLDLNMPGMGGMAACRRIREDHPRIAIIVVTVRDAEEEKVSALQAGADDYVTKPFHLPELVARIGAALRRRDVREGGNARIVTVGNIELDPHRHRVLKNGVPIHLTPTEFDLLQALMNHAGRPLTHRVLLTSVWGPEYGDEREYLRTYINQLRRKIEDDPSRPVYLQTENYIGYSFALPDGE